MALAPSSQLGPYEIIAPIGAGGMGEVYRARDSRLNREVAIKVLPSGRMEDAERKARFIQEARAASALNHPNIVTIHDISQSGGIDFLVMELVRGKTLDQLIGRHGLRLGDTLRYALQIIDALNKAHAAGIIHRDLKPANVMVTDDGVVKLLDFGLAKLQEPIAGIAGGDITQSLRVQPEIQTKEGAILGTLAYMAPEQAEGKKVDARADIFSFGALLYEMVTGHRAFTGDSPASTLAAVIKTDPRAPSQLVADMPRDLEKVILRCLRKDPERRFHHASDIKVELDDIKQESESGRLPPPGAVSTRKRWRWVAVSAVIPLLAATGWYLRPKSGPSVSTLTTVPLTTYSGLETYPAFSPDGNQVAFTWDGEKRDTRDLYIKVIGAPTVLRLTSDPGEELYPAWSPNGRQIAFLRGNAIYLISPIGGQETKLAEVAGVRGRFSWSADGKWIAVALAATQTEASGIVLVSAEGGGRRQLTKQANRSFDTEPSFSPDGKKLAFATCRTTFSCALHVIELAADLSPRGIARELKVPNVPSPSIAWYADSQAIIYDRKLGGYGTGSIPGGRLWKISLQPGAEPEPLEYTDETAAFPATSRSGSRLAYVRAVIDIDLWKWHGGRMEKILSSTQPEAYPQYSPDGKKIAFQSTRSGLHQIWVANVDGSASSQLTSSSVFSGSPYWSPDGRWIVYDQMDSDGRFDIWVIDSAGGQPRRLTFFPENENAPSFSRDGKWVYFFSNHTGRLQVYRIPFGGGEAIRLTEDGGNVAIESWDSQSIYYEKVDGLYVRSLQGGAARQVLQKVHLRCFSVAKDGLYYIEEQDRDRFSLQRMNPVTGAIQVLGKLDQKVSRGMSVSPDGKTVIYAVAPDTGADLRLVDNFR